MSRQKRKFVEEVIIISDDEQIEFISDDSDNDASYSNVKPKKFVLKSKAVKKVELEPDFSDEEPPLKKPNLTVQKKIKQESKTDIKPLWNDYELLAEQKSLSHGIAQNVIKLLEEGNTIPFIARYRRDATGNMSPETLREVKDSFEEICHLKQKIQTVIKAVNKSGQLDPQIEKAAKSVKSIEELEIIYAPFKTSGKRTLAERAKELGLEQPALHLLENSQTVNFELYINSQKKELSTKENVEKGIVHIIAYIMATDSEILSSLRKLRQDVNCVLETKKLNTKQKGNSSKQNKVDESKFENYFDFKIPVKYVKPHQILAINRGEHHKCLSVKILVPDLVFNKFANFCFHKWNKTSSDHYRKKILDEAVKDAYNRFVQPLIIREIRAELKTMAEKASYEVFSKNLKHLLLAPPFKGQPILAIDPGYTAGCKLALVSATGSVIAYDVIFPHKPKNQKEKAAFTLQTILEQNK